MRTAILLFERDEDSRQIYTLLLRHAGFDVTIARSIDELRAIAGVARPSVVLMDDGTPARELYAIGVLFAAGMNKPAVPVFIFTPIASSCHLGSVRALTHVSVVDIRISLGDVLAHVTHALG